MGTDVAKKQFRVKAFVFVNASSIQQAEEIAAGAVGAAPLQNEDPDVKVFIRKGGTKLVVVKKKEKEAAPA